ncbi:tetratricopeptide repeat protein [Pseudoalteromonas sp. MMG005]|uniref:tetratricopeptide repeat protein n=1 Tax=Pseudoalteromonas sp. MMG005 TaxID=2822682 RepID=UPI001B3A3959|nr:tetratricopeptide repeat protein [Pseudoalteromonas sp. MMG005]MBQ4848190.1 tetratricopeptide repeat protein [Pseudoalteromonas sp. MMG005]
MGLNWIPWVISMTLSPAPLFNALNEIKSLNRTEPNKALQYYEEIIDRIPTIPSKGSMELHLAGLEAAIRTNNSQLISHSLDIITQSRWLDTTVHSHFRIFVPMAIHHRRIGDYDYAKYLNLCALNWAATARDYTKVVGNLTVVYRYTGQHKEAVTLLKKSLLRASTQTVKAGIYNNLGNFYLLEKDYKQAESMYKKALKIHNLENDILLSSSVGLNLLYIMTQQQDWQNFARYKDAIQQTVTHSEKADFIEYLNWLLLVFRTRGDGALLTADEVDRLNTHMPMLVTTEIAPSIAEFVLLFDHKKLNAAWDQVYPLPINKIISTGKRAPIELSCSPQAQ